MGVLSNHRDKSVPYRILNEIATIHQLASARLEAQLPHAMTLAQLKVLNHFVRQSGERNINALARVFRVSKPTMGGVIESLLRKEMIKVRADPDDGRSKLVSITERGRRAREDAFEMISPRLDALSRAIGRSALEAMLPALEQLRTLLGNESERK